MVYCQETSQLLSCSFVILVSRHHVHSSLLSALTPLSQVRSHRSYSPPYFTQATDNITFLTSMLYSTQSAR